MPSKELSRRAYKGQLTSVRKIVEKYQRDPENLEDGQAETELIAQRDMVGIIEGKFKAVQSEIIASAAPEDKEKEQEEFLTFMDECLQVEQELSQLIAAITTQKRGYNAAGEASGLNTSSENQTVQQMLSLMQQQLQEQRLQRLSEESKLKELLQNQRKEVETLLEASRNNLTATLENSDILDVSDHSAKLEPIKIPTFSGDYCEWMTFKNLFISSVDKNIRLSKSQKMQYLRNSTSGEALGLFGSLPITDENYTIAWGRLEKRYNNKMIIISAFMDKFLNQPTITKSDVTALRKLQSTTSQALEAVDALGVSSRDPWLIHLALKHLDHQTQTQWSEKCPDSIPTWTDFDEFLEKRCRSLESCPITQKRNRPTPNTSATLSCSGASGGVKSNVLFATAIVRIQGPNNHVESCRAVLDPASQINIITTYMCQRLRLVPKRTNFMIDGVGSIMQTGHQEVQVNLQCKFESSQEVEAIHCIVMPKVVGEQPNFAVDMSQIAIPSHVTLADPMWFKSQKIDLLIGGGLAWSLMKPDRIKLGEGLPLLQDSIFGWLVVGPCPPAFDHTHASCHLTTLTSIERTIRKFWEIEEVPKEVTTHSEYQDVEGNFSATTYRHPNGRYVVQLPLNENVQNLTNNRQLALRQLNYLTKRLEKSPKLMMEYDAIFKEYLSLDIIERVPAQELENRSYYFPHHCVIRESSSTTKVRIVFNGSSKSKSGLSLNDCLLACPTVQPTLLSILWRFRMHEVVLTCDIVKMYLQVLLNPLHRDFQRFLWTDRGEIVDYRFRTVCFGVSVSPYLATKVLMQLAEEYEEIYPIAASILRKNFLWNPVIDAFQFRVSGSLQSETWTKRQLLSTVARIFDPCGLIGPIITSAKLLIQIAWTKPIGWDDPIPDDLLTEWKAFIVDLTDISQLRIPRWISTISNPSHMELHAYCDASMMAYGASIYLVYEDSQCNRSSGLLVAKSRLTPIKGKHDCTRTLTIPKAELCGAELAAQLMSTVSEALKISNTFFWTDSMVVLHWIYAPHGRKDTLVRNKVSKILSSSHSHQWRHVKTSENPADMISRGSKVKSLLDNSMWWHGPSWLLQGPSEWPPEFSPTSHLDFRPTMVTCSEVSAKRPWLSIYEALMLHCSSFVKATRVLAWVLRGVQRFRSRRQRVTRSTSCAIPDHLQVAELRTSEMLLVSWDQASHFKDVLALLKSNQLNKITLPIRKLSPFIDHYGILRVGGRLKNSEQSFETCHPALIGNGKLSEWIAQREHQRLLHAGPQLTLSSIRAKFWPLKGRNLVRSIIHRCTTCIRAKPQCAEQLMGDLPSSRTTLLRPFLHTGMDFTGHILIKRSPRGSVAEKAYVVVFICMSTKAVHLELITSLSSAAFIATFRRFIARRGLPAHIYSDNGTNFVGGEKELRNLLRNHNVQQDLANFSSTLHVQWHFNPPGAPHQGGLWEAAVKSFKTHFTRVVGNVRLTYEELNTIIVQIEAVLNSRPLIALMDDPNDPRSLTPGDFLVGNAPTQLPVDPGDVVNIDHLNRWRLCSKLQHDLTTRWKNDYLHTLQQRNKWNKETPNFTEGDVVLLKTENMSSLEWPLGLVVDVFPGSDGKVRVAQLRVRGKLITRPITKLIKLPVDES
ncbi:uncharacterized protein LOC129806708 [Phlebotomus papatasi]|uniref:uncharacterized protein LOC129806708 n=1 Tax=Phlebotomus papatasi TaxID=29031 RepID=UPI00248377C1|nr:uncharacterized protein LOC129806708 [Phlebotomus papatasi]